MDRHIKTRLCALLVASSLAQSSLHATGDWIPGDGVGDKLFHTGVILMMGHYGYNKLCRWYGREQRRATKQQQSEMDLPARLMLLQARINRLDGFVAPCDAEKPDSEKPGQTLFERVAANEERVGAIEKVMASLNKSVTTSEGLMTKMQGQVENHREELKKHRNQLDNVDRRSKRVSLGIKSHMFEKDAGKEYQRHFSSKGEIQQARLQRQPGERREKK